MTPAKRHACRGCRRWPGSGERIADVEEIKPSEVQVARVEAAHAVLPQHRREVHIGDDVASRGQPAGDLAIDVQESVRLTQGPDSWKLQKPRDVAQRLVGSERPREDTWMRGDP